MQIIKAEDNGKLASTATVNVKVTDINDKNPEFVGDPYNFTVKEGLNKTYVGKVHATDADEGVNALVTYMIPTDLPFHVDNETGEITTKTALDYEKQKVKTLQCKKQKTFYTICFNHFRRISSWLPRKMALLILELQQPPSL